MKKTRLFIFITSLLITLLMVVGCDVSPSITNSIPEGCVEASIMISSSRDLDYYVTGGNKIVDPDSLSSVLKLCYSLEPQWAYDELDKPYGEVFWADLSSDGKVGWVTPGLWKITVFGINENGIAFQGEQEVYFSSKKDTAVVYLKPAEGDSTLDVELTQPMFSSETKEYIYEYSLVDCSMTTIKEGSFSLSSVVYDDIGDPLSGTYVAKIETIPAGSYSLSIKIFRNNESKDDLAHTLVGGITKGLFLFGGNNFTLKGTIEPSDYTLGNIDISLIAVSGNIFHDYNTIDTDITFKLKDSTMADSEKNNYNITYDWYVNGVKESDQTTETEFTYKFSTYGPKEVSCFVTYQHKELTERVYTATIKDSFTITP